MSATAQRDLALERANEVRNAGKVLKEELGALDFRTGLLELARLLRDDPERIAGVKVHLFLEAAPRLGDSGVRWLLTRPERTIWPLKRCRELTDRQRFWLADQLERIASGDRRRVR